MFLIDYTESVCSSLLAKTIRNICMAKKSDRRILKLICDPSFRNWCMGTASAEERDYWQKWISKHEDCIDDVLIANNIVLELERQAYKVPEKRKYNSWDKLNKRIESPADKRHRSPKNASTYSSYGWVLTAAASFALIITTFLAIEFTDFIEVSTPDENRNPPPHLLTTATDYGERKIITLDSGTTIRLNANSSVTYYDGWVYDDTVKIRLEGEAYFDVVSRTADTGPVFQVETDDGDINVLGTRFMVNTWDKRTKVILEKGEVAIRRGNITGGISDSKILKPNELAEFSRTLSSDIRVRNVNTQTYTSWTKGVLVFEKASLTAVADRIEKIYGKEVEIEDQELLSERVSGAVENNDLEVLLSALSRTLQISVIESADRIIFKKAVSEGSFYKQNTNKRGRDD